MKSPILRGSVPFLLLGSLLINLWTYSQWRDRHMPASQPRPSALERPTTTDQPEAGAAVSPIEVPELQGSTAEPPGAFQAQTDPDEWHSVVTRLQSQGFPSDLIMAIAIATHTKRVGGEVTGAFNAELNQMLGKDPEAIEAQARRLQLAYGGLDPEKIAAIEAAKKEASSEYAALPGPEKPATTVDALMLDRLRLFLTPSELDDFELYNSGTAESVQHFLRKVNVTESEYLQLVRSALQRERQVPGRGSPSRAIQDRAMAAPTLQEFQDVLGPERFSIVAP
jgi:hypothetical protein